MMQDADTTTYPSNITRSLLRKRKKHDMNHNFYGKTFAMYKDLVKLCEGQEELWTHLASTLNNEIIHLTKQRYDLLKESSCDNNYGESCTKTTSICAPIENNHRSGRYKSYYERNKK
jgi:hypothetical protein